MGAIRGTVRDGWPLVGRDEALAEIVAAFDHRGGAVLVGASGVGKSRLAREASGRLTRGTAPPVWAAATRSAAATPLGALAHLVDTVERRSPEVVPATGGRRPVLVIDDAHLLDDASAALVHRMATRGQTFVLATVRAGRPAPDAVTALWTAEVVPRIDVRSLTDEEIRGLLQIGVGRLDALSEEVLVRLAAGNPLLLRELLLAGRTTGALRRDGGLWRWTGAGYVTPRLTEELAGAEAVAEAERRELVTVARSGARLLARLAHPV